MVHIAVQSSLGGESFTKLSRYLIMMFDSCTRQTKSSMTTSVIDGNSDQVIEESEKLSIIMAMTK